MSPEQSHTPPLTGETKQGDLKLGTTWALVQQFSHSFFSRWYWEEKMVLSPFGRWVYSGAGEVIVHSF